MKITLANGTDLNPLLVTGEKRTVQGMSRDTLRFVFPAEIGLDALDAAFTDDACESITIETDSDSHIHKGYTIRAELKKAHVEVIPATHERDAEYEERIVVAMSQRTYKETQLASLTDTVDMLVMESLMNH